MTYTAILSLAILRDGFSRLDRDGLIQFVKACQCDDGRCVVPFCCRDANEPTRSKLLASAKWWRSGPPLGVLCFRDQQHAERLVGRRPPSVNQIYSAVCRKPCQLALNLWCSDIACRATRAVSHKQLSRRLLVRNPQHSHITESLNHHRIAGGTTYCALACLALAAPVSSSPGESWISPEQRSKTIRWLLDNQVTNEGFSGRTNKLADACYCFWCSASLQVCRP